ncbi:MAG: NUDIX hydrolase [Ktedonobacteraceae bacterium]
MTVQPRPASTVLLLRDTVAGPAGLEVFMVRRVVQSEFMPDIYVFPGGSVSDDDHSVEQTEGLCVPVHSSISDPEGRTRLGTGVRAAAIRELFEEANILLAYQADQQLLSIDTDAVARFAAYRQAFNERRGSLVELAKLEHLLLATDSLAYFSHWITPEGVPKRYDVHFFLASAPAEQEAIYDQLETSAGTWIQPGQALERFAAGNFPLAFPTHHQLQDLAQYNTVQEALATKRYVSTRQPLLKIVDGVQHVYLPEDPTNAWNLRGA